MKAEKTFYEEILPSDGQLLVFDIGANRGHTTRHFLDMDHKVIAVEPEIKNFNILERRYKSNENVVLVKKAVSDKTGTKNLFIEQGDSLHTFSDKWKETAVKRFDFPVSYISTKEVDCTTLDQLIELYGSPDVIKIDVEGHEQEVIAGLSKKVNMIIFECNLPDFGSETMKCIDLIKALGNYRIDTYHDNRKLEIGINELVNEKRRMSLELVCELLNDHQL